jgi:hypothetical protein
MAPTYGRNKRNPAALEEMLQSFHPIAQDIVRPTFGLLIYQEQVMCFAREMAGMDWPEVQRLRKEVGDKLGTQPDIEKRETWKKEWSERFINGCEAQGVCKAEAVRWWSQIVTHGGYSFNRSHAVTYALLSYWMFYLKVHYRDEFYAAYLELEDDAATRKRMVKEFVGLGGTVKLIDPTLSRGRTRLAAPGLIVGGWSDLHRVGAFTTRLIEAKYNLTGGGFSGWPAILKSVPKGLAARLEASGLPVGKARPQSCVALAPWFPVQSMPQDIVLRRDRHNIRACEDMPDGDEGYDEQTVRVAGYITARDVSSKYVGLLLEDETGYVPVRVSQKKMSKLGAEFRGLVIGDLVMIAGWWSGDCLYADSQVVIARSPLRPKEGKAQ